MRLTDQQSFFDVPGFGRNLRESV